MTKKEEEYDGVKEAVLAPRLTYERVRRGEYLNTGSTLLNLALTDTANGGWMKGSYSLFIGDSDSGKSFFCMTSLAEAAIDPKFDGYRFVVINKERGILMDVKRFFGSAVADRLEMMYCDTLEEMYYILDTLAKDGVPYICIVDSIDAMDSKDDEEKFQQHKSAAMKRAEGKKAADPAGSYGTAKAKIHSNNIKRVVSEIEKSGSIIIFINQTRDKIGAGMFESNKTHSGGKAISFYATMRVWSSQGSKLKKTYKGKPRQVGLDVKLAVERTRVTGRQNSVYVPIYHSYGIDDVGSCVDYLLDTERGESHWKKKKGGMIVATEFEEVLRRDDLINYIEENDLVAELRDIVEDVWVDIRESTKLERKPRYN